MGMFGRSTDSDVSCITGLTALRTKRGARKRNIGRLETYLRSVRELSPKHLKVAELNRQLDFLQGQSHLYQEIQEGVLQFLEVSDSDNRLEAEELELEDQCLAHASFRDTLQELFCTGEAYKRAIAVQTAVKTLESSGSLAGTYFK